jgi:hypothetical protein
MFGSWTNTLWGKLKQQLLVGVSAFYWTIWLSINDVVFNKALINSFFVGTLQRNELATYASGHNWKRDDPPRMPQIHYQKYCYMMRAIRSGSS